MLKRIKPQFLFSVFLILTLIFFAALIGCTSGQMIINIPMATDDIVGIWEGDLSLADRNSLLYESVLEIAVNDELCFATFTAVENEESEISGFGNILMEGRVAENRLLLISRNNTQEITYEATFAFANLKKTILSGLISRHSTESTDNRAAIDTWQGDLDKRIDPDNSPIVFEDPNLEKAVRNADGFTGESTGTIYPDDVSGIIHVDIENCQIVSLEGLQHLINLKMLNAKRTNTEDLTPLRDLIHLKILNISANPIVDLSPLEQLIHLECLRFYETQVSDLSPIHPLTKLKTLDFADAQVSDLSPIINLTNVTYLNCGYNMISDLSPLKDLINLQSLWLISNQIEDISPLVDNPGLGEGHYVDIRNNQLDLTVDSEDMQHIEALITRGVTVFYEF